MACYKVFNTFLFYRLSSLVGVGKFRLAVNFFPHPFLTMRLRPPVGLLLARSPVSLLGRLFRKNTSSSALSLSLLEFISGQSTYTDSHPSIFSYPHSVVTRLGNTLDRDTTSSTATFLTSQTEARREGCRLPGTTQPDLRYVASSGVSPAHNQSQKASSLSSCFSFPTHLRDSCVNDVNKQDRNE